MPEQEQQSRKTALCVAPCPLFCITNCHKPSDIKQGFVTTQFYRSEAWNQCETLDKPHRVSQGQNQDITQAQLLSGGSGRRSTSKLVSMVNRTQFCVFIGVFFLACTQQASLAFLEAALKALYLMPEISKPVEVCWVIFLFPVSLAQSSSTSRWKVSAFKGLVGFS